MKKIISLLSLSAIVGIFALVSCKKDLQIDKQQPFSASTSQQYQGSTPDLNESLDLDDFINQINWVGQLHNNYLAEAYLHFNDLKNNQLFPTQEADFKNEFWSHGSSYFVSNFNFSPDLNNLPVTLDLNNLSSDALAIVNQFNNLVDNQIDNVITIEQFNASLEQLKIDCFQLTDVSERYALGV